MVRNLVFSRELNDRSHPTWQYFLGMDYFEHRAPCDPTLIGKFRKLIGEGGVEERSGSVYLNRFSPIDK